MTFDDPAVADEAICAGFLVSGLSDPRQQRHRNGPGFRAQSLLFLDDLMPSLFGQPPLTRPAPDNRQIAW
jgi:hypothetical protein